MKEDKQEKERSMFNLEHQLAEQKEKISRAEKNLRKAYKDIRLMCQCRDDNLIQLQEVGGVKDFTQPIHGFTVYYSLA